MKIQEKEFLIADGWYDNSYDLWAILERLKEETGREFDLRKVSKKAYATYYEIYVDRENRSGEPTLTVKDCVPFILRFDELILATLTPICGALYY
jgi:hypothetical protein